MDEMVKLTLTKKWTIHYHFCNKITTKGSKRIQCTGIFIKKGSIKLKLQDTESD